MAADKQVDPKPAARVDSKRTLPSADNIKTIGGLVAVAIGVLAITTLAIATMAFIDSGKDATTLVPLSTAAFGVISTLVGAYLGIKIGTDQSKSLAQDASQAHANASQAQAKLAAIQGYVDPARAHEAQEAAEKAADADASRTQT